MLIYLKCHRKCFASGWPKQHLSKRLWNGLSTATSLSQGLFAMYLTQWPAVFLLKDAVKKASTDLPTGNGSRYSVGSAGVWVSVQGHRLRAPIGSLDLAHSQHFCKSDWGLCHLRQPPLV